MSSTSIDPYQTPLELTPPHSFTQVSIVGSCLLVPREYAFPPVCLKTGEEIDLCEPITKKIYWYHPAWLCLLLVNLLIFLIVVGCIQKKAVVTFQLSNKVRSKHRKFLAFIWSSFLAGLLILVAACFAVVDYSEILALIASLLMVSSIITGIVMGRLVKPVRIDERHVWLRYKDPIVLQKIFAACETAKQQNAL